MLVRPPLKSVLAVVASMETDEIYINLFTDGSWSVSTTIKSPVNTRVVGLKSSGLLRKKIKKALDRLEGSYNVTKRETNSRSRRDTENDKDTDF